MATITIKTDFRGMKQQIKNLNQVDMKKIGFKALELNFDQIQKRKDIKDRRFKPYTEQYARRKGTSTRDVDLVGRTRSSAKGKPVGTMLKSYNLIGASRYSVTLGFRGAFDREKARYIVSGSKNKSKAREFVGVSSGNRRKLMKFAFKQLTKTRG